MISRGTNYEQRLNALESANSLCIASDQDEPRRQATARRTAAHRNDRRPDTLKVRHAQTPADTVTQVVDDAYRRFDGQPIRDFVPLLVERRAQERLGGVATAVPTPLDD